jgi:hypothetical protein
MLLFLLFMDRLLLCAADITTAGIGTYFRCDLR